MLKSFNEFTENQDQLQKRLVVTFRQFNPPVVSDERLIASVAKLAGRSDYKIYASHTQDKKKNPLGHKQKISYMRKMFPRYARQIVNGDSTKTLLDVADKAAFDGYDTFEVVTDRDHVNEFETLLNSQNGQPGSQFNFKNITVISSDDADDESATDMREAAVEGDFEAFSMGIPSSMAGKDKQMMFDGIRDAMDIKEDTDYAKVSSSEIRDLYKEDKIFLEDSTCANLDGETLLVLERGPNFITAQNADSGEVKKHWLKNLNII
tara:strand:- start:204 stop:995 length:792 start_codon:yes stop_codon:yes gene_type:complete